MKNFIANNCFHGIVAHMTIKILNLESAVQDTLRIRFIAKKVFAFIYWCITINIVENIKKDESKHCKSRSINRKLTVKHDQIL